MTPQQMRIAVAEFAGTSNRFYVMKRGLYYRPKACGYTSCRSEAGIYSEEEAKLLAYPHDTPVTMHPAELPDYCNSLDDIAQAEALLSDIQLMLMRNWLEEICERAGRSGSCVDHRLCTRLWRATAAQRSEALLRTIGKWTDTE